MKKQNIPREILENLYLTQNLSLQEMSKILKKRPEVISRRLKEYSLIKSLEQRNACLKRIKQSMDKESMKQRYKETMKKKYGVENPMQSERLKSHIDFEKSTKKRLKTIKEKYGENFCGYQLYRQRLSERERNKLDKEMSEKIKDYYNEHPEKSEQISESIRKHYHEHPELKQQISSSLKKTYREHPEVISKWLEKRATTIREKYGESGPWKLISKTNREWQQYLREQLNLEFRFEVDGFDLFYENEYVKLAIEINPTISHNSTYSFAYITGLEKENRPLRHDYHYKKYLKAKELGYFLISVFDWYDREKIVDLIKSKLRILPNRIFARKCEIREITDNKLVRTFLDENHLQNWTQSTIKLGLFHNDELLQIATFGKPRRNKHYDWELIRICSKKDWLIVGGESKLISFFKQNYCSSKDKIMSYENLDISQKEGKRSPSYGVWINREGRMISCTSVLMRGASRMIGDNNFEKYPYGKYDNEEIMIREGYVKVYNCGNVIVEI